MQRSKGFTLVELLVVIGIIALLISILLPTLNKVKVQAQQVKCSSTLRSVGQFYTMYASTFKNKYPNTLSNGNWAFGDWAGPVSTTGIYDRGIGPTLLHSTQIIKNPSVLYCPVLEGRSADEAQFSYDRFYKVKHWDKKVYKTPTDGAVYTSYVFWAGYPANMTKPGQVMFPYQDPDFFNIVARSPRSRGDSVLASDMMITATPAWQLKSNHIRSEINEQS